MLMLLTSSCSNLNQRLSVSDFCSRYNEVIVEKGDAGFTAKTSVKKRIAANEVDYKCNCKNIKADYCKLGN